ncbi:hypothetical protein JW992_14120 [candidate division KSB1 bacterium]|nr:hypothetical protein [candidate division KSB1 bacterium]
MAIDLLRRNQFSAREFFWFKELGQKYFLGIEEKICSATTREEAKSMLDQIYTDITQHCESDIVRLFFKRHYNEVLDKYWR